MHGNGHAPQRRANDKPNFIGQALGYLRRAEFLTRAQLALLVGVPRSRIDAIESGRATLGYLEGQALAKAIDVCPTCLRRKLLKAEARAAIREDFVPEPGPDDRDAGS